MTPFGVETRPDSEERVRRIASRLLLKRVSDVLREIYEEDTPGRGIRPSVGPKGHMLSALSGPDAGQFYCFRVSLCHGRDRKLARRDLSHMSFWRSVDARNAGSRRGN